jgi:ribosomal protein S18 acetylase RimI-like enzyme
MAMKWELDLARPADCDTVIPLVRAFHEFEGVELTEAVRQTSVRRLLAEPALGGIWLIDCDGEIAGYIALCLGFSLEFGGHDAFIDELYLEPPFRGRGGGKIALEMIKKLARERGVEALHLEVARDNAAAQRLYAGAGLRAREHYVLMSVRL